MLKTRDGGVKKQDGGEIHEKESEKNKLCNNISEHSHVSASSIFNKKSEDKSEKNDISPIRKK